MNLREFSKKIGLPISTISKALGGYKDVNYKTRDKIVSLAKKYKYVPNVYAKTLASRNTPSVGLVLPLGYNFIQKNALIDFIQNIYSELNKINIPVIVIFAENKEDEIKSYDKLINHHKVSLIILNDTKFNDKRIKYLDKKQVSYLTWGRCNKTESSYTWIDEDIKHSSELAVQYIISKGHKRICFVESEESSNYFQLRKKYFLHFCKKYKIKFYVKNNIRLSPDLFLKSKDKLSEYVRSNPDITMYLLASHQFANIAIESFRDTQKNIGKDISLISFDSNFLDSFAPYLTTISQPVIEVNKNLINLIIGKLNNMKSNKNFLYKSKLNEKNSVIDLNNF
jgi:DNA-binding LacI/PurR family transcriptional regulator